MRGGQLVVVLEEERRYGNEIYAVWPQNKHLPSKVRAAIDVLVARIPERLSSTTHPVKAPANARERKPLLDRAAARAGTAAQSSQQSPYPSMR